MANDAAYPAHPINEDVLKTALSGLQAARKTLPPKLFYDEEGCRLFYEITRQPEYYLTRTERVLLADAAPWVAASLPTGSTLVEYGASDEEKASFLLRASSRRGRPAFSTYVPIDVAAPALQAMQERLRRAMPDLAVHPITADFNQPVTLPLPGRQGLRLGFFPGSTIGNLEPSAARQFLRQVRRSLGDGARLLIGADLHKGPEWLIPAYNDAAGVTAAFNLNLLVRLNREAGSDFNVARFAHRAIWNERESRIEMHLVSLGDQTVHLGGKTIQFTDQEVIHTENSYKYHAQTIVDMTAAEGWHLARTWNDPKSLFALYLLQS